MRRLEGFGNVNGANTKNPVTPKQKAILGALSYFFEEDMLSICKNAKEAFDMIGIYENRIEIAKEKIYIDGELVYDKNGIVPNSKTFTQLLEEIDFDTVATYDTPNDDLDDYYDDYDVYDPQDMSTWDDDDWINFELEH